MDHGISHINLQEVIEDRQPPHKITATHVWNSAYLGALILWIINKFLDPPDRVLIILMVVLLLISIIAGILSRFEYHPAKHRNLGIIGIYPDHLLVDSHKKDYRTIKNLEFNISDYKGMRVANSGFLLGQRLSQGVENYIRFAEDEKTITLQIQMRSRDEIQQLHGFLIQLYLSGIDLNERDVFRMAFTDVRYAQIQELKKQRAEKIKEKQRLAQQGV